MTQPITGKAPRSCRNDECPIQIKGASFDLDNDGKKDKGVSIKIGLNNEHETFYIEVNANNKKGIRGTIKEDIFLPLPVDGSSISIQGALLDPESGILTLNLNGTEFQTSIPTLWQANKDAAKVAQNNSDLISKVSGDISARRRLINQATQLAESQVPAQERKVSPYEPVVQQLEAAIVVAEGHPYTQATLYLDLANVHSKIKTNLKEAELKKVQFEEFNALSKAIDNFRRIGLALNDPSGDEARSKLLETRIQRAVLARDLEIYDSAVEDLIDALDQKPGEKIKKNILTLRAKVYDIQKKYKEALSDFDSLLTIALASNLPDQTYINNLKVKMADLYSYFEDFKKADELFTARIESTDFCRANFKTCSDKQLESALDLYYARRNVRESGKDEKGQKADEEVIKKIEALQEEREFKKLHPQIAAVSEAIRNDINALISKPLPQVFKEAFPKVVALDRVMKDKFGGFRGLFTPLSIPASAPQPPSIKQTQGTNPTATKSLEIQKVEGRRHGERKAVHEVSHATKKRASR